MIGISLKMETEQEAKRQKKTIFNERLPEHLTNQDIMKKQIEESKKKLQKLEKESAKLNNSFQEFCICPDDYCYEISSNYGSRTDRICKLCSKRVCIHEVCY
jgi:hypothetical protein